MTSLDQYLARQHPTHSGFNQTHTADDVIAGIDLTNHHYLVTGGYSGIGLEMTRALSKAGASVIVPARRADLAAEALHELHGVSVLHVDLSDLSSVESLANALTTQNKPLNGVIASAGVMATPERRTEQGWEYQFAINHLGHFALICAITPLLTRVESRVVMLSSAGHFTSGIRWNDMAFAREQYDPWLAYGQSKTANSLFAVALAQRGREAGVRAYAVHPGNIASPLQRHVSVADQIALGWFDPSGKPNPEMNWKTPQQGASTALWALTSPALKDLSGSYAQDNDVAHVSADMDMVRGGVKPWALDPDQADRLWEYSIDATGVSPRL